MRFHVGPAVLAAALLAPAGLQAAAPCVQNETRLCLNGSRFQAEVSWAVPGLGTGSGHPVPLTGDTGAFWFFSNSNLELIVKVLDGRTLNRHFWVFYGGLSDVEYTLTVTDTQTGVQETYHNPAGKLASAADVTAFDEEAPAAAAPAKAVLAAAKALPPRTGSELQVNVETLGMQWQPAVAMAPDGGYLVVWLGTHGVSGRLYDAAGKPRTDEFPVSTPSTDPGQWAPRVAASSQGGYLVVWADAAGTRARGRFLDAGGQPVGSELQLGPQFRNQDLPDVAADADGNYVVVWLEGIPGQMSVQAQRFGSRGEALGGQSSLAAVTALAPRLAASPLGGSVVTWIQSTYDGNATTSSVRAQRLDGLAQPQGLSWSVTGQSRPGKISSAFPLSYGDGRVAVIWSHYDAFGTDPTQLFASNFGPSGNLLNGPALLWEGLEPWPPPAPAALVLPSGETWVLWSEEGLPEDPDGGVVSGIFDVDWNLNGGLSRINTWTYADQAAPAVAGGGGKAVAVWQSGVFPLPIDPEPPSWQTQGQDGSYLGVYGQLFATSTCALDPGQLCLNSRFRVRVQLTDPRTGLTLAAHPLPLTGDTGGFWFFDASNVELVVKVLDGRGVNGHFWVYAGALSDVDYILTVSDSATGKSKVYRNPAGRLASLADTAAF